MQSPKKKLTLALAFYVFIFLALAFFSYKYFFINTNYDVIGHNWDWTFPGVTFLFERVYILSVYIWNGFNLGRGPFLNISHLVPNVLVSALAYVIGIKFVILLLLFCVNLVSFISFKKMLNILVSSSPHNYIPSLLYAFSPFLLNEIIGGSWYMWISYAFAPLFVYTLFQYIKTGAIRYLVYFLLSAVFVISSLQNFVLLEVLSLLLLLIHKELSLKKPFYIKNVRYFVSHASLFIFNLYWLLPLSYSIVGLFETVGDTSFTGNFNSHYTVTQSIATIMSIVGYLDRNMYYYMLPTSIIAFFLLAIFIFWFTSFIAVFSKKATDNNKLLYYFLLFFLCTFFVKGGNPPFGDLTVYIYRTVPLFSLYRSIQHTMFSIAFLVPLIMSAVMCWLLDERRVTQKIVLPLFLALVCLWTLGWWYRGDLGSQILKSKTKDHIDIYSIDPDFQKILLESQIDTGSYRVLFIPTVHSPLFLDNKNQDVAQGGIPEYLYLEKPTFSAESNVAANIIDTSLCKNTSYNWTNLLKITNVRYVIFRNDIVPIHTVCGKRYLWDAKKISEILSSDDHLDTLYSSEDFAFYKTNVDKTFPHIYIPQIINTDVYTFNDIALRDDVDESAMYVDPLVVDDLDLITTSGFTKITSVKINPTYYNVKLSNVAGTFPLVFLENFESGWKIFSKEQTMLEKILGNSLITENNHFTVNGYANAWKIDTGVLCKQIACEKINNSEYSFELSIVYWPQLLLYIGAGLSAIFFIIILFCWVVISIKKKN